MDNIIQDLIAIEQKAGEIARFADGEESSRRAESAARRESAEKRAVADKETALEALGREYGKELADAVGAIESKRAGRADALEKAFAKSRGAMVKDIYERVAKSLPGRRST